MPVNASYEYTNAEKVYGEAKTLEEKIAALEEMIKVMPGHKSAENLRANLRNRLVRFKEQLERAKKNKRGSGKKGIKKEGPQVALIGLTGSGKSSFMALFTNTRPEIADYPFVTREPLVGTWHYEGARVQIIDLPAINTEYCDLSVVNNADTLLIFLTQLEDLKKIEPLLKKALGKKIIIINKIDFLQEEEKRRLLAKIQSKKIPAILISIKTQENLDNMMKKIFESLNIIRIYTKEPGKESTKDPFIAKPGTSVSEMAEKIKKGLSKEIRETRIWGPSSKFPGQKVGLSHILQDKDIVEFHTR